MRIKNEIADKSDDFKKLCIENKVKSLYTFGSSITAEYDPDSSDIDLLVEIDEIVWVILKKYLPALKSEIDQKLSLY